jgi:DNA polymerase III delta prime subunit
MNEFDNLWCEKYRPQTLDDISLSEENREVLNGYVRDEEIPNLLFVGSPGAGKTTLARILVLDVLGCDFLYINASDENGIDTVRNKISGFVQTKSFDGNIKVVVLDEVDGFTKNGQDALRNMMESYADNARFILTGNYKHKITKAIQSRCQTLDIRVSIKQALQRCLHILDQEGISIELEQKRQLATLVKAHFPDLRKCINEMQKFCTSTELKIAEKSNTEILCAKILEDIADGNTLETRKYLIENDDIFNSDWGQLLIDLLNNVYKSPIEDIPKKQMILTIADHLEKSSRVIDQEINFFACVLNLEQIQD